jgi:type II secretory pathway pseudopilin PulG
MTGLVDRDAVAEPRPGKRCAAGLSLIEMMVALAVLILLAGLVVPTVSGMSESVEFRETCDQLSSAVSVCRSEAQRRGTPMELVVRKESDGRVSLVGRPARLGEQSREQQASGGQVLMVLPGGYSIDEDSGQAGPPDPEVGPSENTNPGSDKVAAPTADASEAPSETQLVVFWASGGASKGAGLYLHGKGGRVVGAEINSFTGMLKLEPVAAETADEKDKSDSKQEGKPGLGKPGAPLSVDSNGP